MHLWVKLGEWSDDNLGHFGFVSSRSPSEYSAVQQGTVSLKFGDAGSCSMLSRGLSITNHVWAFPLNIFLTSVPIGNLLKVFLDCVPENEKRSKGLDILSDPFCPAIASKSNIVDNKY